LRGARLVLPDSIVERGQLHIEHGRISNLSTADEHFSASPSTTVLDLDGLTLFPGFIDIHIHGAIGVDTMEATTEDLRRVAQFLARHGVTAWLPTLVPAPVEDYAGAARAVEQLMREQDEYPDAAARALGLHYEGPFINSAQCGALRPPYFRTFRDASDLDALATINLDGARHLTTVAPEIEGGVDLVRELTKRGWIVSIGHTRATVDILDRARAAGAQHMTHFLNAMSPLHHRAPGPIGWGLLHDDVTCDVIADGIHSDTLMLRLVLRCKTAQRVALISDAVAPTGMGDGDYRVWGETITVKDGRTSNARGSIAGSVITMNDAVRMMHTLGASPQDVARMAATNPARLLGIADLCGTIEEGKRADLVALDDEGKVQLTLVGGRVAFQV
jgi:N-acetylglucosamine-6-phosphate deacetylase